MRDHQRYDEDFDSDYESGPQPRSVLGAVESVLLLGALALIATPAIKRYCPPLPGA